MGCKEDDSLVDGEKVTRGWTRYFRGQNAMILMYSMCLLVTAVGNSIYFKKMTNVMPNYPYFLSCVTTLVYVPIFFGAVIYSKTFTNAITPETENFPKKHFFYMGFFDAISGVFMLFGGVHTSGSTQALLTNAVIPITMFLAYVILKTRFTGFQYTGAATIMLGVVMVLLPQFLSPGSAGTNDQPLFNIIFLVSILPSAMSSVYKEMVFSDADIDVNYMQAWVALWQVVFCVLVMPLNTLSFLGPNTLTWAELPNSLWNGMLCLGGIDSVVAPNCLSPGDPLAMGLGLPPCDACSGTISVVAIYMVFNCSYNVFMILVIKYGSAALMYIVMTIRLPIVQFAFSLKMFNDPPDSFSSYSLIGLVAILFGLVLYRYKDASQEDDAFKGETVMPALGQMFTLPIRTKKGPKSVVEIRRGYLDKLGFYNSPATPFARDRSPIASVRSSSYRSTSRHSTPPKTPPGSLTPGQLRRQNTKKQLEMRKYYEEP